MLYSILKNSLFKPVEYYESIAGSEIPPFLFLTQNTEKNPVIEHLKKKRKAEFRKPNSTYTEILDINKKHTKYMLKLKGKMSADMFMPHLYRAELSGAEVEINDKKVFVLLEKKNSIVVIDSKNKIRTYIKKNVNIIYKLDGITFILLGRNLNLNRFVKK